MGTKAAMQVIITMAGLGQRFRDAGYSVPKPFIKIGEKTVLDHLLNCFPRDWKVVLAVNESFQFENKILQQNVSVVPVPYSKRGPLDTVRAVLTVLDLNQAVCVSYCDYVMLWDPIQFIQVAQNADAAIVSYRGFHPTYYGPNSYCHMAVNERSQQVLDLQEKKLFTEDIQNEWTSCGLYYFKSAAFLKECLLAQEQQNLNYNGGEFYTSLAIKAMMNLKPDLKVLNYPITHFIQLGTPEDTERFEFWYQTLVLHKNSNDFKFRFIPENKRPINLFVGLYEKEKMYWLYFFESCKIS